MDVHDAEAPVVRAVLRSYDLRQATVSPLPSGTINRCYRVDAAHGSYVLKWYASGLWPLFASIRERVQYVCEVQEFVRAQGFPTPETVRNGSGGLLNEEQGQCFVLTRFASGRQHPRGHMPEKAAFAMGAALGWLMDVLADFPAAHPAALPGSAQTMSRMEKLLRLLEAKTDKDEVDEAAGEVLRYRLERLERWSRPLPDLPSQLIHGDYQDSNVIFDESDNVAAVIDFDNVTSGSRAFEVMRAFSYSFPEGDSRAYDLFAGYLSVNPLTEAEAADCAYLRAYAELVRLWPVNVRLESPEQYQNRWDEFILQPTGWWQANVELVAERLAQLARRGLEGPPP